MYQNDHWLVALGVGGGSALLIRVLHPIQDVEVVSDLYRRTADYVWLEVGRPPDASLVAEYFADAPPGGDPATSLKLGLFEGSRLVGVADLAFYYPEPCDAYLGRMMLAQEARGQGWGKQLLRYLEDAARKRGAVRLLISVLETNSRGRAFWEREGFGSPVPYPPLITKERIDIWIRLEKPL